MLIYAQLEDAVIARIQAASDSNALGYRLASIGSYGGEFDDEIFFTQFRKFPAIWVTVGGDTPKKIGAKSWECTLKLAVMVGARNVRGERFTRHGSVGEVGTYQMAQDVRDILIGQSFNGMVSALDLGPQRTLFNTRMGNEARSVISQELTARYTYRMPEEVVGEYTGINQRYYLKPGDELPDAVDEVQLGSQQ